MYRALKSFTTKDYDVKQNQILQDDFTTHDEIQEFLSIGYIRVYNVGEEGIESNTVFTIWTGTQAQYDLLTPDNNTLYFIEEA